MVYTRQDAIQIENFLDAGQVAEMLGLSVATIRKWVLIRYIPYRKLGGLPKIMTTHDFRNMV
jgi:DNA-binding transcriptional MerR regulator